MAALLACVVSRALAAEDLRADWTLQSAEAAIGQSLILRLDVKGADAVDPPRLSVPGVEISWQGGGPRNSTSMMTVNGSTTTTVSKSFAGSWSLKAKAAGSYHLDPVDLKVGGKSLRLGALDWTVRAAPSSDRYFLRQKLKPDTTIPGLEVEYSLVWYLGESARGPEFNLPILDEPGIELVQDSLQSPNADSFQVQYGGHTLVGIKGTETVGGKSYTTLSFDFKVKASKSGRYDLSGTGVTFEGVVGSSKAQDFFGNIVEQPSYGTLSAQAPSVALVVRELPEKGKLKPFSGLIGKLSLGWEGARKDYRVGEPIRLKLKLGGVLNKPDLDLDYMVCSALSGADFQAGADETVAAPAAGAALSGATAGGTGAKGEAGTLERSYVLRAKHPGALRIPALKLNYFDPEAQRYGEAKTDPIDLSISGSALSSSPVSAAADAKGGGLLRVNPPESYGTKRRSWPWWLIALPGAVLGAAFSAAGLWRHSRRRALALGREEWRRQLVPLDANEGRAALEEGRERLRRLALAQGPWAAALAGAGKFDWLSARQVEWDQALFSDGRGDEAWADRWRGIVEEARTWK